MKLIKRFLRSKKAMHKSRFNLHVFFISYCKYLVHKHPTTHIHHILFIHYQFICNQSHSIYNYSSIYFSHHTQQNYISIVFTLIFPSLSVVQEEIISLPSSNPLLHLLHFMLFHIFSSTLTIQIHIFFTILVVILFIPAYFLFFSIPIVFFNLC